MNYHGYEYFRCFKFTLHFFYFLIFCCIRDDNLLKWRLHIFAGNSIKIRNIKRLRLICLLQLFYFIFKSFSNIIILLMNIFLFKLIKLVTTFSTMKLYCLKFWIILCLQMKMLIIRLFLFFYIFWSLAKWFDIKVLR